MFTKIKLYFLIFYYSFFNDLKSIEKVFTYQVYIDKLNHNKHLAKINQEKIKKDNEYIDRINLYTKLSLKNLRETYLENCCSNLNDNYIIFNVGAYIGGEKLTDVRNNLKKILGCEPIYYVDTANFSVETRLKIKTTDYQKYLTSLSTSSLTKI